MTNRTSNSSLTILMDNQPVGRLSRDADGTARFVYEDDWLGRALAPPVSIALPVREEPYFGDQVLAVFDNLLPDSKSHQKKIAKHVGAVPEDSHDLFAEIGQDCSGALHVAAQGEFEREADGQSEAISGEPLDEADVERLLENLPDAPLGLTAKDRFRVAIAGAQKKTGLLLHQGQWFKPHGRTPTTHIFKTAIGRLPTGTDLSNSVENEYYCLKLAKAFGLPVANAEMATFGAVRALIVERFDRKRTEDGQIVRLPQEDMCQALSVHPSIKYERQGGPGVSQILEVLNGSDDAAGDQEIVLKAQILFWLTGATDGHAKNFSIFVGPGGTFHLAPLYDILTVEPSIADGSAGGLNPRLAMSVGKDREHTIAEIGWEHFMSTAAEAGLPPETGKRVLEEMADIAPSALQSVEAELPDDSSASIHDTIISVVTDRLRKLRRTAAAV